MKKISLTFILIFMLSFSSKAYGAPDISAGSAIVIDSASGRVLFEKNAEEKRGMASTTKIMTALLSIERLDTKSVVTVSPFAAGTEGSSIWLSPGEHMTVSDLLYGLMLSSGNDAATALAEFTSGSVESFTVLMNEKAREIGAYNTHFANPHGLPADEHYTTAHDLALIASKAMKNDLFREIVSTKQKTISWEGSEWNRSLKNHNKLLTMYEYANGIKTGFTKKDGRCLVSSAEKDGLQLIGVTLSAPDDWNDHINLMNWCFDEYKPFVVCEKGKSAGRLNTEKTNVSSVGAEYGANFVMAAKTGEEEKIQEKVSFSPLYPIKKGDKIGRADIYYEGQIAGSIDLISTDNADIKPSFGDIMLNLLKGLVKT